MIGVSKITDRCRRHVARFGRDKRGLAAVEFAFIVPLMLTLIFGTIEVSSGVAIDRKVTLAARTISDLVTQAQSAKDVDLKNIFGLGSVIIMPYPISATTLTQKITAVNVDGQLKATVAWSKIGSVTAGVPTLSQGYSVGTVVTTIPPEILVANTQLVWSEVTYSYTSIVKYIIPNTLPLTSQSYTRPRQSATIPYSST